MQSKRKSPDPARAAVVGDPVLVEEDMDVKTELEELYTQVKDGPGDDSWFQTGLEVERIVQSGMCVCVCVCVCVSWASSRLTCSRLAYMYASVFV
jgi:hypothetical protein